MASVSPLVGLSLRGATCGGHVKAVRRIGVAEGFRASWGTAWLKLSSHRHRFGSAAQATPQPRGICRFS